jgi:Domain of unknown function (DUF4129)
MTDAPGPAPRRPSGLPILLLLAVGFGVVVAVLATPITSEPPPVASAPITGTLVPTILALLIVGWLFAALGVHILRVASEGRFRFPGRAFAAIIIILLLLLAFVGIAHILPGGSGTGNTTLPPGNTTGSGMSNPSRNGNGNNSLYPTTVGPLPGIDWLTWAVLGGIVLAISLGVLLAWFFWPSGRGLEGEESDRADAARLARLRAELESSLRKLEDDPNADPRAVIQALYHRLLLAAGPHLPLVEASTPREIAQTMEAELGAAPEHAELMTRLFEEARYSTHPMDRSSAERARTALRALLADLDAWIAARPARTMSSLLAHMRPEA